MRGLWRADACGQNTYLYLSPGATATWLTPWVVQGFPEEFKIVCGDYQTRKQAGNSLPVNVAEAVLESVFDALGLHGNPNPQQYNNGKVNRVEQLRLLEKSGKYYARTQVEDC